jgi:hypothetical protein
MSLSGYVSSGGREREGFALQTGSLQRAQTRLIPPILFQVLCQIAPRMITWGGA